MILVKELRSNRYPLNFLRQAQFWTALPFGCPGPQSVNAATFDVVLDFQRGCCIKKDEDRDRYEHNNNYRDKVKDKLLTSPVS